MLAAILLAAALPQIPFERYQLPNGLTVILSEDHRAPIVGVDLWYRVGAVDERPGRSGFAHLFEHLMFQGSKHLHGDERTVISMLERNGATSDNASTEWDRTNFFETMPRDRLELALWVESDRMGFLLDTLDQKKLDTQREVVRNERRQNFENTPYAAGELRLIELLYPLPSPYHGAIIGSHEDLRQASLDEVKAFFRDWYAPNNASIAIVGDFDPAEVKAMVEKYFAPIPRGPALPKVEAQPSAHEREQRATVRDQVQLAKVLMGWVGPPPLQRPAMNPLLRILAGGKSSRLYHDLVYQKKIAQDVAADWGSGMRLGGYIELSATVQAGHTPQEVEQALADEVKRLRDAPPADDELARARRNIQSGLFAQLENVGGFGGKADLLDYYDMWAGGPEGFTRNLEATLAATPADVQKLAQEFLRDEQRVVVTILPAEGAK